MSEDVRAPSDAASAPGQGRISARGVAKRYRTTGGGALTALEAVDLSIGSGEFVSLIGPSGCGKTTLLKMIGALVTTTDGSVEVDGEDVEVARRRGRFGFVFQEATLLPWRSVLDNATLLLDVTRRRGRYDIDRVRQLLELVGLGGFESAYPAQLSGGMQQRAALARALALDPAILLMDEPFAALDALTRERMGAELMRIWEGNKTVVFVTHSIAEAVLLSDRVVVLSARPGRIRADLTIDLPRPRSAEVHNTTAFLDYERRLREEIEQAETPTDVTRAT